MYRTTIPFLVLLLPNIDAQITNLNSTIDGCIGGTVDFNWTYNTSSPVYSLEWKVNGSRIAIQVLSPPQAFTAFGLYVGRLTLTSNAQVSLAPLSASDVGAYKCEVTYTDNSGFSSTESILHVYDELNNKTEIVMTPGNGIVTLKPSFYDSSITYTWKLQGNDISTGSSYDSKLDGNYTLCISGGRANCLNPTISSCDSIEVSGLNGCNYLDTELFLGGFSCFLIVLITTIIMLIILACKMLPEIFGDLSTNKKTIKIIIIAVFILVALIIGLALGFGLKECNQRDLGLGLGLGLGFLLAIALVVTLYIYHRQCDSKKGNEDENRESPTEINSKKPEDNPKRVRSTASASHVKMESKCTRM